MGHEYGIYYQLLQDPVPFQYMSLIDKATVATALVESYWL